MKFSKHQETKDLVYFQFIFQSVIFILQSRACFSYKCLNAKFPRRHILIKDLEISKLAFKDFWRIEKEEIKVEIFIYIECTLGFWGIKGHFSQALILLLNIQQKKYQRIGQLQRNILLIRKETYSYKYNTLKQILKAKQRDPQVFDEDNNNLKEI